LCFIHYCWQEVDEAVFMSTYIPRTLHELPNTFEEARRIAAGEREKVRGKGKGDGAVILVVGLLLL